MLLQLTTHRPEILFRVKDDPLYRVSEVCLPAGTYIFRRTDNPVNPDGDDWIVLDQSHLQKLNLGSEVIVGMSYAYLALCNSMARSLSFYNPKMRIDVQEIAPTLVETEPAMIAEQAQAVKLPLNIIPWPIAPYPNFIRHDPSRRRLVNTATIHDRLKRLHPAARRAC
jgi:hypothetical protein